MASRKEVVAVKHLVEDRLLGLPGVFAVDVARKEVGGQETGEDAIVVWVRDKRDDVPDGQRIPSEIHGVPTDVVQGEIVLSDAMPAEQLALDTLVGGLSLGPCSRHEAGTLGVVVPVTGYGLMALTNYHVAGPTPGSPVTTVTQPALPDGGDCPGTVIGHVFRGSLGQPSNVDAALVIGNGTREARPNEVLAIGQVQGVDVTFPGDHVQKVGRTTGRTTGVVVSDEFSLAVHYPVFGPMQFTRQITVRNDVQGQPFQAPGDSGAVLVNDDRELVGLMFAVARNASGVEYGVANPIQDVLRALDLRTTIRSI